MHADVAHTKMAHTKSENLLSPTCWLLPLGRLLLFPLLLLLGLIAPCHRLGRARPARLARGGQTAHDVAGGGGAGA